MSARGGDHTRTVDHEQRDEWQAAVSKTACVRAALYGTSAPGSWRLVLRRLLFSAWTFIIAAGWCVHTTTRLRGRADAEHCACAVPGSSKGVPVLQHVPHQPEGPPHP